MTPKEIAFRYLKNVLKPARYTGGEIGQTVKNKDEMSARVAFCFPDTYEIGMSNLGVRILYDVLNAEDDVWCERSYAPWPDMGELLKSKNIPLYALESGDALTDFDFVAFSLSYEMSYTNVLYMMDLANIPLLASERDESFPLIIGGGSCAYNAEPIADFFDLFNLGEGEESLKEIVRFYINWKKTHDTFVKADFLHEVAKIPSCYVPSHYEVIYKNDGTIQSISPKYDDIPKVIEKAVITNFDKVKFPEITPIPFTEIVHDRIMLECARGCLRGCRFCQAGTVYRPYRAKTPETLVKEALSQYENSGYEEISLTSLSISDYPRLEELVDGLKAWTDEEKVGLSLPSMRIDSFEAKIMQKVMGVRKSGLTFAPEAGTQRLRNVINKNLTEEEILNGCRSAFAVGRTSVKLYFMLGLPTETDEDILGIADLAQKVVDVFYENPNRQKGKSVDVTLSVACLVPKSHTPFEWFGQDTLEELDRKQMLLKNAIHSRKIHYKYHDGKLSRLEAVFARGDRKLSKALLEAHNMGLCFDAWDEYFDYDKWMTCFENTGISPDFYATRQFDFDEILPWEHIFAGVNKEFLLREAENALTATTTPDCLTKCSACGANKYGATLCAKRTIDPKEDKQ